MSDSNTSSNTGAGANSLIKGVDHIAIAVADLEAAISFYGKMWGAKVVHREYIEKDKVN